MTDVAGKAAGQDACRLALQRIGVELLAGGDVGETLAFGPPVRRRQRCPGVRRARADFRPARTDTWCNGARCSGYLAVGHVAA